MIVDVGGETIQITVLELLSDGDFRELYAECDVGMGGNKVDEAYEAFLTEIFGADVIREFKKNNQEDYKVMRRQFESMKMSLNLHQIYETENVSFRISGSFCDIVKESVKGSIALSKYQNEFVLTCGKAKIKSCVLKRFFEIPLRCIFDNMKAVFAEPQVSGCSTILMVGGFSRSPILQEYIQRQFPDKNIIIPQEADIAVIKGAVIFGHT
ncbi:heat shock 70 kDa protein 12A-like [Ruditapes philippinarum]|uniref:heat shock 70 kDa protein 12A-like n=1 Tax=Ruditapes philippinarum TaxID=129788 RepID=UPI00295A7B4C|nr:heat shock 70 kDa protein 12A-like [Ruditapes philippinarum]